MASLKRISPEKARRLTADLRTWGKLLLREEIERGILPAERDLLKRLQ